MVNTSIFIKYFNSNTNSINYIKTDEEFESRIVHTLIDESIKLSKCSPDEWDRHIKDGRSVECITERQTKELIADIQGI